MDDRPVLITPLPGTNIVIEDGLNSCGLGIVTVSCAGSRDIPAFEKKCVMYYPYAEAEVQHLPLIPVIVRADSRLVYATTMLSTMQYDDEEFERDCVVLELTFESQAEEIMAGLVLSVLGQVTPLPEGRFFPYVNMTIQ